MDVWGRNLYTRASNGFGRMVLEDVNHPEISAPRKRREGNKETKRRKMKRTISRIRSITIVTLIVIIHQSAILIYIYIHVYFITSHNRDLWKECNQIHDHMNDILYHVHIIYIYICNICIYTWCMYVYILCSTQIIQTYCSIILHAFLWKKTLTHWWGKNTSYPFNPSRPRVSTSSCPGAKRPPEHSTVETPVPQSSWNLGGFLGLQSATQIWGGLI